MTLVLWFGFTVFSVIAACIGLLIFRRFVKAPALADYHSVTDPMMACVGTLFAILLGFMVANAMTRFEEARVTVQEEAGSIGDIFRLSSTLPPPTNIDIMTKCVNYMDVVCLEEFPLMEDNKMSLKAQAIYQTMWKNCSLYEPKTQRESNIHQCMVDSMMKIGENRRARTSHLTYRLPMMLWAVVIAGAASVVIFTYLFGIPSIKMQLAMTMMVTAVIALNIYLLVAFDSPFGGEVRIAPVAFQDNRLLYRHALEEEIAAQKNGQPQLQTQPQAH